MLYNSNLSFMHIASRSRPMAPFGNFGQALVFTKAPVAFSSAAGTVIGSITGKASGSTLSLEVATTALELDGTDVVVGTGTQGQRYLEPGYHYFDITETLGPQTRKIRAECLMLPTGKALGDPWTPFLLDYKVYHAFVQEDLADGAVAAWPNRGFRGTGLTAANAVGGEQPSKLTGTGGVEFTENTLQRLHYAPADQNRAQRMRGTLTIFRVDVTTGSGGSTTVLRGQDRQGSGAAATQLPAITFTKASGIVNAIWQDPTGLNTVYAESLAPDYATWIVVKQWVRNGKRFVSFNAGPALETFEPGLVFSPRKVAEDVNGNCPSTFGASVTATSSTNCTFAIDCHLEFAGEFDDEFGAKLDWWAAERAGHTLPVGHKYELVDPVFDELDFSRDVPVADYPNYQIARAKHVGRSTAFEFQNRGGVLPSWVTDPFDEVIFNEDFRRRAFVEGESTTLQDVWFGNGGLSGNTIGIDAGYAPIASYSDLWLNDTVLKTFSIGTRVLASNGQSAAAYVSTANAMDDGVTFDMRNDMMFTVTYSYQFLNQQDYYFDCPMWFYANSRAKWLFNEVYEVDLIETEGLNDHYNNGLAHHWHEGIQPSVNGRPASDYTSPSSTNKVKPVEAFMLTTTYPVGQQPYTKDIYAMDGQQHTSRLILLGDTVYVDIDGMEILRFKKTNLWFRRFHGMINVAIRYDGRTPIVGSKHWMTIHKYEVRQKASDTAVVPSGSFTARPTIAGATVSNNVLTVTPNLKAEYRDARVEFYDDTGYPLARWTNRNKLTVDSSLIGKRIRAKVLNESRNEIQEAWTAFTGVVTGGGNPITTMDLNFASNSYMVNGVFYGSFAALQAAIPGFAFLRSKTGSIMTAAVKTPYVAVNTPRIDGRGLLYEGAGTQSATTVIQSSANVLYAPRSVVGPDGGSSPKLGQACYYSTAGTVERRLLSFSQDAMIIGDRLIGTFAIKAGSGTWIRFEGLYEGQSNAWYNVATNTLGTSSGITYTRVSLGNGWYQVDVYKTATTNFTTPPNTTASIGVYPATGDTQTVKTAAQDLVTPAFYLAQMEKYFDPAATKVPLPHYGAARAADQLQIPLGPSPRNLLFDLVEPHTLAASQQTLSGISGDYIVQPLNQPVVARVRLV